MEKGSDYLQDALERREDDFESSLRPSGFDAFAGQPKTVERLKVMVGAAKKRGDTLSHILLHPPVSAKPRSRSSWATRWERRFA